MEENKKTKKKWLPLAITLVAAIIIILLLGFFIKNLNGGDEIPTVVKTEPAITVETRSFLLEKGESKKISVKESDVTFESSNTAVAIVKEDGTVTAVGSGMALITITKGEDKGYCGVIVDGVGTIVDISSKKATTLFSDMMLNAQTKILGMGVDETSNAMYFSQVYGASAYIPVNSDLIVTKVALEKDTWTRGSFMRFGESGEGHLDVENGKIWIESGGSYLGLGETISCVDWEDKGFVQGSFGQTYNVGELEGTKLAVDSENNMVAVYDSSNKQYLIYDKSALVEGAENAYLHAVVCAKDQEPALGVDDSQNHYNTSIRGFALADGYIYQISGGNSIYVSVFDLSGKLQYCKKIEDNPDLQLRMPAAIAVENGNVYLCVQSGDETCYFANVWKY